MARTVISEGGESWDVDDTQGPRSRPGAYIRYGMSAGMVAAIISTLFWMALTFFRNNGFWTPLKTVATAWLGPAALGGGFVPGFTGAVFILVVAMIWGGAYGWIVGQGARSVTTRVLVGLLVSFFAWEITTYFVIPSVIPYLNSLISLAPGSWFGVFLVYGACLTLVPALLHDQDVDSVREPDPRLN